MLLVLSAEAASETNYLTIGFPRSSFSAFVNNHTNASLFTASAQPEPIYTLVTCQNNLGIAVAGGGSVLRRGTGDLWGNLSQPFASAPKIEALAVNSAGCLVIAAQGGVAASLD